MKPTDLELEAERLLRTCAILPLIKGFLPLRDLILLYYLHEIPADHPRKAVAILRPRYGKNYRAAMRRALLKSWRRPECRLTEYMGGDPLAAPPPVDRFALALARRIKLPA